MKKFLKLIKKKRINNYKIMRIREKKQLKKMRCSIQDNYYSAFSNNNKKCHNNNKIKLKFRIKFQIKNNRKL